jgi:TetR/AcrR family transcriptional regulator
MTLSTIRLTDTLIGMAEPRRSPSGADRKRDAERTRERILDAALVEFGEHGFAGARVGAIARRAGVNQQLISYYFDGKEGLYRALNERWRALSAGVNQPGAALGDVVSAFADVGEAQRHWVRLLVWQALEGNRGEGEQEFRQAMVDDLRQRQAAGEIAPDLDPPFLMLLLFGATLAPTLLAHFAADFTGLAPDSPEFRERYAEQLRKVVARLS